MTLLGVLVYSLKTSINFSSEHQLL